MKASITLILKIALAAVIIFGVGYMLYGLYGFHSSMGEAKEEIQQRESRLLYETDHRALLEACRDVLAMAATGDLKESFYKIHNNRHPSPEASRLPQLILQLDPMYVFVDGRCLVVEMYGGLYHCGVRAYPKDFEPPYSNYKYGDKKLIDGLWYYAG